MKVLAIDPGMTTGLAYGVITTGKPMVITTDQKKMTHIELWHEIVSQMPEWVVCEDFEYRNKSRTGLILYSLELIGVCELYAAMSDNECTLWRQKASVGKGYYSDAHLRKHGVYVRGRPHGMDALRHLLHWYTFGPGYQYNTQGFV